MKKIIYAFLTLFVATLTFTACSDEESVDINDINKQTILVFMPWSGDAVDKGLYSVFLQNLDSIEQAIQKNKGYSGRLVVFLSTSSTQSDLYEIAYNKGKIVHTPIKTYSGTNYTTPQGITEIINDVKNHAYALNYAMMIGCHGCGWISKNDWKNYPFQAKKNVVLPYDFKAAQAKSFDAETPSFGLYPTTRFFGSVSDMKNAIDISDLATGIRNAGVKMQFILFDDCYMANVETAYELRETTNFLIGSTSEVMSIGVPYQTIWTALATPTPSYATAVKSFNTFYKSYAYPYGALSAIDCRETEGLANIMKEINSRYTISDDSLSKVQVLDGYDVPLFYDIKDYVSHLCENKSLLSDFHIQLDKVVVSTATTDNLYSYIYGYGKTIQVKAYSGLTISDPSRHAAAIRGKEKTGWWASTH